MGAERLVAFCSGAPLMQVSRSGILPNQTVAKYVVFWFVSSTAKRSIFRSLTHSRVSGTQPPSPLGRSG